MTKKASHRIIRPVGDLWLWWTLASMVPYLAGELYSRLQVGIDIDSSIITLASSFIVLWALARYLGNFDWWRWVVVTVVGGIIGAILGLMVALIGYGIIRLFTNEPNPQNDTLSLMLVVGLLSITSVTVAIGQWRVLRNYAAEEDRGLWIRANLLAGMIAAIAVGASTVGGWDSTTQFVIGIAGVTLGSLIVGYMLTRILGKSEVTQNATQRASGSKGQRQSYR